MLAARLSLNLVADQTAVVLAKAAAVVASVVLAARVVVARSRSSQSSRHDCSGGQCIEGHTMMSTARRGLCRMGKRCTRRVGSGWIRTPQCTTLRSGSPAERAGAAALEDGEGVEGLAAAKAAAAAQTEAAVAEAQRVETEGRTEAAEAAAPWVETEARTEAAAGACLQCYAAMAAARACECPPAT